MRRRVLIVLAAAALAVYVERRCAKIRFEPVVRSLPALPILEKNYALSGRIERVGEGDLVGPESLVEVDGYLFTGLADGRIVRFVNESNYETVARSCEVHGCPDACGASPADSTRTEKRCGRPLGMRRDGDDVIIADAYMGLLRLRSATSRPRLERIAGGLGLLNDVAVAAPGEYYVTETSTVHRRRRIFWAAFEMRARGRILAVSDDGRVRVVVDDVYAPNGIELVGDHLLVVSGVSVLRIDIATRAISTFVPVLPGTGDNLRAMDHLPDGRRAPCFWFGLGSKYARPFSLLKAFDTAPLVRKLIVALVPYAVLVQLVPKYTLLAAYDADGDLLATYQDPHGRAAPWLSEAHAFNGFIYLGSWYNAFLARVPLDALSTTSSSSSS